MLAGQISGLRPSHTHTQQTKRLENPAVHIDYLPTHSAPFVRKDLSPFIPPWVASRTTPWTRDAADRWRSASRLACPLALEKDLCLAYVLALEKGLCLACVLARGKKGLCLACVLAREKKACA